MSGVRLLAKAKSSYGTEGPAASASGHVTPATVYVPSATPVNKAVSLPPGFKENIARDKAKLEELQRTLQAMSAADAKTVDVQRAHADLLKSTLLNKPSLTALTALKNVVQNSGKVETENPNYQVVAKDLAGKIASYEAVLASCNRSSVNSENPYALPAVSTESSAVAPGVGFNRKARK